MSVSVSVGCGWIDSFRSEAVAPISIATTPSAINSPAPEPAMPTPEDPLGLGIDHQLRQAVNAIDRNGPARGAPRELRHLDLAALLLGVGFGQAGPGDFRDR